jgi:hypothetical protein
MSRTKPVTVPVSELPAFLRDLDDANAVALALEAQKALTLDAADTEGLSVIAQTAIRVQADAFNTAADEVRDFAKRLATRPADASHNPNAGGTL